MFKKMWKPIAVAAIVALVAAGFWVSSEAFAKGSSFITRLRIIRRGLGEVMEISEDSFVVQKLNGDEIAFGVTDESQFRDREGNELSFDDLRVGGWVIVRPASGAEDEIIASIVVILPEDFEPQDFNGARGVVTSVNLASNQFMLQNRQGEDLTYEVSDETRFGGAANTLDELQEGMIAIVGGKTLEDGSLQASFVRSSYPQVRKAGEIVAVNPDESTFTLKAPQSGEEYIFSVDEKTRFRSKDNSLTSLDDLRTGMVGFVIAREIPGDMNGESDLAAVLIAVADKDDLPQFDLRAIGKITALEADSLTIEARNGETYTIQIDAETRFRSRGGMITSLEDLKEGMFVVVGAQELDDGSYVAQLVIVKQSPLQ